MVLKQTGTPWKRIVTLQDRGVTNPLFGGSVVYCMADNFSFSGQVFQGIVPKLLPPTPDFIGSNIGSVWDSLKTNASFSGVENPVIKMTGRWTTTLGSVGTEGELVLTPYKIFIIAHSGRTVYVQDERIVEQMILESGSQLFRYGVPVVIKQYDLKAVSTSDREVVTWSLDFLEDRD